MLILEICNWSVNLTDDFDYYCVIDIYSKYAWVVPLKDKKGITITKAFQNFLDEFNRKPNKLWVDKGSEFYNRSVKSWLQDSDLEMYSRHSDGKSVVAKIFIRMLKHRIYKYTFVSKNVYIDKLDDIVNKLNNTYHRTIKMKPVDIKSSTFIDFGVENNEKYPKFENLKKHLCWMLNSKLVRRSFHY